MPIEGSRLAPTLNNIFHLPWSNSMLIREDFCLSLFALTSTYVKFDVWPISNSFSRTFQCSHAFPMVNTFSQANLLIVYLLAFVRRLPAFGLCLSLCSRGYRYLMSYLDCHGIPRILYYISFGALLKPFKKLATRV